LHFVPLLEHVWKIHSEASPHPHYHPIHELPKHELDLIKLKLARCSYIYIYIYIKTSQEKSNISNQPASNPFFPKDGGFDKAISAGGASSARGSLHCNIELKQPFNDLFSWILFLKPL